MNTVKVSINPNSLILVRQNIQKSQLTKQLSQSFNLHENLLFQKQQTNALLTKTLKYLNKNHDFINFKNKILVPRRRKIELLELKQLNSRKNRAENILISGVKSINKKKNINLLNHNEHSIYANPLKSQEINGKPRLFQSNSRKRQNRVDLGFSRSISKIQQLSSKQKQQTIAQNKYQNTDYIFLNEKNLGESVSVSSVDQYDNQNFQDKDKNKNNQISPESSIKFQNRLKIRSLTKYDRDLDKLKRQQYSNQSNLFCQLKDRNKNKLIQRNTVNVEHSKEDRLNQLFKLIVVENNSNNSSYPNNQASQNIKIKPKSLINNFNQKFLKSPTNQKPKPQQTNDQRFKAQIQKISSRCEEIAQKNGLFEIMSKISQDTNKDTIRIYRDDYAKVFTFRYGRDRITSFFQFQYIEDYDSQLKLLTECVLKLNKQEILLTSFLMLDFDNDGLISHSDIFKLLTIADMNILIKKNIYTILKYVKEQNKRQGIFDECQDQNLKKQGLTLKKFKFINYMKQKKKNDPSNNDTRSNKHRTRSKTQQSTMNQSKTQFINVEHRASSLKKQLFVLQPQFDNPNGGYEFLKVFLTMGKKNFSYSGLNSFSISFQRFKQIYSSNIPEIFYDMLFTVFGLRLDFQYEQVDYQTPLIRNKKQTIFEQISQYKILQQNLQEMRQTKTWLTDHRVCHDLTRIRKIKSSLD